MYYWSKTFVTTATCRYTWYLHVAAQIINTNLVLKQTDVTISVKNGCDTQLNHIKLGDSAQIIIRKCTYFWQLAVSVAKALWPKRYRWMHVHFYGNINVLSIQLTLTTWLYTPQKNNMIIWENQANSREANLKRKLKFGPYISRKKTLENSVTSFDLVK